MGLASPAKIRKHAQTIVLTDLLALREHFDPPQKRSLELTSFGVRPVRSAILLRKLHRIGYIAIMYHVYLLRSIKNSQMTYVGFTTKNIRNGWRQYKWCSK